MCLPATLTARYVPILLTAVLLLAVPDTGFTSPYASREQAVETTARTLASVGERGGASGTGTVHAGTVHAGTGRIDKVWVHFTDKGVFDAQTFEERLAAARETLDDHAARRRAKTLGSALVDFHDLPVREAYTARLEDMGARVVHTSRWLNAASVEAPLFVLEAISRLPFVHKLTPVARARRGQRLPLVAVPRVGDSATPGRGTVDPFDYGPSRDQLAEITVVEGHTAGYSGAGVRIAMLDTGYWREHPAFARLVAEGRLIAQWDFIDDDGETQDEPGDPEGQHTHGTITWSLIAGFDEGELVGTAHGAEFLLAKTEDTSQEVPAEEDNWVAGAEWADAMGADIISSSLSYIAWYTYDDMDGDTATTTIAADIAASRGIVVCAGAGNQGTQDWFYIGAPADADSIIAVGGTQPDGSMWLDSSHGPTADGRIKPEVCARGASAYAAQIPGGHGGPDLYRYFDGTSVACPLVAGAAALVLEAHPGWSAMQVREALMLTADNATTPDNHRGWGRIDLWSAIGNTSSVAAAAPSVPLPQLRLSPNPFSRSVRVLVVGGSVGRSGGAGVGDGGRSDASIVEVFSPAGRLLRVLRGDRLGDGFGVEWDGRDAAGRLVARGTYVVRVRQGQESFTAKAILMR